MCSLKDKIESINSLRKEALSDPSFLALAKEHEQAIEHEGLLDTSKRKKRLSELYVNMSVKEPIYW